MAGGAAGAVSGLASSFPDAVVALVRDPTPERGERVGALRAAMQALPFHAATKAALGFRGVGVRGVVRPPLRTLREDEVAEVERIVREWDA
jgi:dihydrodipicolinate synthase/N-acetylneuraminate lyase